MIGDEKEDELKETQLSQDDQLPYFLEEFIRLAENIEVRGIYIARAREVIDDFILQINAINNIREVEVILHNIVMQWRSDLYLFTTDVISPVLFLLERVTNEGFPNIHQYINDILNYLNQNPLYSQSSDISLAIQGVHQQGGVQEVSQEYVADDYYDSSLGALAYLGDYIEPAIHMIERRNEFIPHGQQQNHTSQLQGIPHQSPGNMQLQPYDERYDFNSQNFQTHTGYNQYEVIPDHQPSPDWWLNSQETNQEESDTGTLDNRYEEGKTNTETQHINFCSELSFINLPESVFDKNSFSKNDNQNKWEDNIIHEVPLLNEIDFRFLSEDDHELQTYDIISLVALISMFSNAITFIYEG